MNDIIEILADVFANLPEIQEKRQEIPARIAKLAHPIESKEDVNEVMRLHLEITADMAALSAGFNARLDALKEQYQRQLSKLEGAKKTWEYFVKPHLAAYAAAQISGKKSRYVDTDFGRIGFRKGKESLEVTNEEIALAYCEKHGLPIRVKKELDKKALAAHHKATGEIPDGIEYKEGEDNFYYE
ncbi:MAG: host-nuclease inhibitor Gam family protein [Patescibacteria group bacterium]